MTAAKVFEDRYETFIEPRSTPTLDFPTRSRPTTSRPNTLRVYAASPEDVALQIRFPKHFAHVNLHKDEALALAEALKQYAMTRNDPPKSKTGAKR